MRRNHYFDTEHQDNFLLEDGTLATPGGIIGAVVAIAAPTSGFFPSSEDPAKLNPATFVPTLLVAKSKPVRFGEIYGWNNGEFDHKFYSRPGGVLSTAPIEVWNEYVRRFFI